MRCRFCDVPYALKGQYRTRPVERLLEALTCALADPVQPAAHILISGGTPAERDYGYLRGVYRSVLSAFKDIPVDIMAVPIAALIDVDELAALGVNELSLNLELWDGDRARRVMPEKDRLGRDGSLTFIAQAVRSLGRGRVRSILMVGLEPLESTLKGVEALASVGCVPVLSPFRPDPKTELAALAPPSAAEMMQVFAEASKIANQFGIKLGPRCIPCSHNTMTFTDGSDFYRYQARRPNLI